MKMKMKMISDYCMVQKKYEKANTIIVFSAKFTPKGKFRFTHALEDFDGNVIYLNSKKGNDWYTEGVEGLGDSYSNAAESLKKMVKQYAGDKDKILTLGGSMGGYGAMLYGSIIDADYSLATGTELITTLFGGRSFPLKEKINFLELRKIISGSSCQHHLCTGAKDPVDMLNYSYCWDCPKISWYIFKNQPHEVIMYMHNKYNIAILAQRLLLEGKLEINPKDLETPNDDISEYVDNYLMYTMNRFMLDFSLKKERNRLYIKEFSKRGYHKLIISILKSKDVNRYPGVAVVYFRALLKEKKLKLAKDTYDRITDVNAKNRAKIIADHHKLFD